MANVRGQMPKFPGNLMRVVTRGASFGTAVTLDCKEGSSINTDLARLGRKGMVKALFIRVKYTVTVATGGADVYYSTRRQRGCTHLVTIEQPGVADAMWQGQQPLSFVVMGSQIANLPATRLARYFTGERGEVPPALVNPLSKALVNGQQPDTSLESAYGFGDFQAPAVCAQNTGAPVVQAIDDIFPIAPCLASRRSSLDVVPFHYFSNDSTPVKFTVLCEDPATNGMYTAGTTATGLTVELWAYIVPNRADKDRPAIGVPFVLRTVGREGPTVKFDENRVYRFAGLFPKFRGTQLDAGGLRFYYEPYSWPAFMADASLIKWQEQIAGNWQDTFPLLMSSGLNNRRVDVVDLYNNTAAPGWEEGCPRDCVAPMIFPVDPTRASSILSDRMGGMTVYADIGLGGMGFDKFVGIGSFAPIFPYALTGFIQEGFPGFGSAKGDCYPRILFDPDNRPVEDVTEIWANPAAVESIKRLDGSGGCPCTGEGGAPQYKPALDNPTSKSAAAVAPLVPVTAPLSTEYVMKSQLPAEAPPGVVALVEAGKGKGKG